MRTATGSQGMLNTHRNREPFPPSSDLQKTRSARNEAGKASGGPHALTQGGHSPVHAGHAPHRREPCRSVEWRPKLEEAGDHERKAPVDRYPAKAYRSGKSTSSPSTYRHPPYPQARVCDSFCLLQQQQNNKRKEKHHPRRIYIREGAQLHNPGAGRNKTSTTGNQWDDKNRPSPRRLGEDQRQGGRREASPHRRSKLQSLSLSEKSSRDRERERRSCAALFACMC